MAIPKGKRTTWQEPQNQTEIKMVKMVCEVTKKSFDGYEGQLPVSKEGWAKLTKKKQKKYLKDVGL